MVSEYLDGARRAGLGEVRIVHGRGRGVQRALVRRILTEWPGVAGFDDRDVVRHPLVARIVAAFGRADAAAAQGRADHRAAFGHADGPDQPDRGRKKERDGTGK